MADGERGPAAEQVTPSGSLTDVVDEYRKVRGELERSILPLATSVDGRQFTFQASLHDLEFQTGGYVVLEGEGGRRLGQVLTMRTDASSGTDLGVGMKSSVQIRPAVVRA